MHKARRRLSYANVMATVAVFLALGGTSYALSLGKFAVKPKNIAPGAVNASKIANGAVRGRHLGAIVVRVAQTPMPPGASVAPQVLCHPGEQAIGGGADIIGGTVARITVVSSAPIKSNAAHIQQDGGGFAGWQVIEANSAGGTSATAVAQVVCLQ